MAGAPLPKRVEDVHSHGKEVMTATRWVLVLREADEKDHRKTMIFFFCSHSRLTLVALTARWLSGILMLKNNWDHPK